MSDAQGLGFASLAEDYDRGRGGWPPELHAGIEANTVLDLAAGTGKLTALLAERYQEVVAVEPLPTMRKILLERVFDLDHEWTMDTVGVTSYSVSVSSMGALADEARVELRRRLVELTPAGTHRLRLTARGYRGRRT